MSNQNRYNKLCVGFANELSKLFSINIPKDVTQIVYQYYNSQFFKLYKIHNIKDTSSKELLCDNVVKYTTTPFSVVVLTSNNKLLAINETEFEFHANLEESVPFMALNLAWDHNVKLFHYTGDAHWKSNSLSYLTSSNQLILTGWFNYSEECSGLGKSKRYNVDLAKYIEIIELAGYEEKCFLLDIRGCLYVIGTFNNILLNLKEKKFYYPKKLKCLSSFKIQHVFNYRNEFIYFLNSDNFMYQMKLQNNEQAVVTKIFNGTVKDWRLSIYNKVIIFIDFQNNVYECSCPNNEISLLLTNIEKMLNFPFCYGKNGVIYRWSGLGKMMKYIKLANKNEFSNFTVIRPNWSREIYLIQ